MKIFFIRNNRIKLVRFVVSYKEHVITDTLETESKIKQFLNTNSELEELLDRLNKKGIAPEIENIDVSGYEVYENRVVENISEAEALLNPDIEELRDKKITEIENCYIKSLIKGCEVETSFGKHNFSCTLSDLYMLESDKSKSNFSVFIDFTKIEVSEEDFNKIYEECTKFQENEYIKRNRLLLQCNAAITLEELSNIIYI